MSTSQKNANRQKNMRSQNDNIGPYASTLYTLAIIAQWAFNY